MRADCRFTTIVLCAGVVLGGCTQTHANDERRVQPAPANADLGAVLERFYQDIEGRHWQIAYAMLSPHLRSTLSESAFEARYAPYADADVTVGQSNGLHTTVQLNDAAHHRATTEDVTLKWDGEDWTIDGVRRTP